MNDSSSNWVYVCEKDDIDLEDLKRFDYEDKTFCIYKLKDGIYATDGLCTHEEVHLEDGLVCIMKLNVLCIKAYLILNLVKL